MNAPDPLQRIAAYTRAAGLGSLTGRATDIERAVHDLVDTMAEEVSLAAADSLYEYPVPMLTEDGTCSVVDTISPTAYDLGAILGGRTQQTSRRLVLLKRLVARVRETTGADWIGIYQRRVNPSGIPVLVKVAYVGNPSRAEFPLTAQFASRSTNATVGLTGHATVIEDVSKHVEAGGGFYVCDSGVQSEACLPILDDRLQVAGIVDAEATPRAFFGANRLAILAALCIVAPAVLP
jgi:L-methionine (R)-S-oxide reductase